MKIFPLFLAPLVLTFQFAQEEISDCDCAVLAEAGLEIPLPDKWHFQEEPSRVTLFSKDFQSQIIFKVSELQVPDARSLVLTAEISETFQHPEITSVSGSEKINNFLVYSAQGVGVRNSEIEEWKLEFIVGARKSVLAFALGEASEEKIDEVLDGLRMKEIEVPEEESEKEQKAPSSED